MPSESLPPNENDPVLSLSENFFPESPIIVYLIKKRLLVFDPVHANLLYRFGRYFGHPIGIRKPKDEPFHRPLELSFFEAYFLLKNNIICVQDAKSNHKYSINEFYEIAKKEFPNFSKKYLVYEDLRNKNYIPRPGQKFGADFVVYKKGPGIDHSSFCIQVLSSTTQHITSIDVVRAGRLANSVKKRFVLVDPQSLHYFQFRWFKP